MGLVAHPHTWLSISSEWSGNTPLDKEGVEEKAHRRLLLFLYDTYSDVKSTVATPLSASLFPIRLGPATLLMTCFAPATVYNNSP